MTGEQIQFIITAAREGDAPLGNCNKPGAVIKWGPGYKVGISTLEGEQSAECMIIRDLLGGKKVILSCGKCQNEACSWNTQYTV
jgi:hypothetical protein